MKKIAVTGTLSCGKSTVCRFLAKLGAYVVSADEVVHHLLSSDSDVCLKVVALLGPEVLVHNQLSREAIAKKVFSNPIALQSLEKMLHPLVFRELQARYLAVKDNPEYTLFVAEVPLLYETKSAPLFDAVVVVLAKEELCKKRFYETKKQDPTMFTERMLRQMPAEEKAKLADFILVNNGSLLDLKNEVKNLVHQIHVKKEIF